MADIKRIVEDNYLFLLEARKYFHRHAELSGEEWETSAYIRKHLDEWDIPYEVVPGHTSIVATIKGDNPGKTIAIRGDFDALPIQENTGIDYPSVNDEDWDSDRYVGDACDFNAKLEDVTFDGKDDIVIFLGHQGTRGVMYSCAYIYTDMGFVYCRSFEEIPNYDIDTENMLITGRITSSAASYSAMQYSYDSSENRFVEINCTDYEYDEASGEYIAK